MKQKRAAHPSIENPILGQAGVGAPSLQRLPPRTEAGRDLAKRFATTQMLLDIDFSPLEARIYAFLKTRESSQEEDR